ncbi:response regulator [Fischerella sp. PCC 9605]|uniref:response regulator n=1 Tax=Fischerella sp. PCC 9605 TaxID=1173024 RepID=UPI00047E546D|nr:response regulator [Fischerella sp. PCC 9605]
MTAKSILLIDDEKHLSTVIQACLEKLGGWTVLKASSGSEGLRKAEAEHPDAILLDVMMPDIDGVTLLHKLQENPTTRAIPVVLLTAKVQQNNYKQYSLLRIAGVIAKPFDPLRLADQVAEALNWK